MRNWRSKCAFNFELKWPQVLSSMAKTRIVMPNTGSKRKKSCQTEAVGSSLDKTLTNYVNWDWFVSKLWRDQLWQTTFAGDLAVWRPHGVPTRSPVTTLLLWVHTVEDDLQEIVSFSQSAAVWLCQQVQFDSKCFPLSNRLSIVLFTDGGSVTSDCDGALLGAWADGLYRSQSTNQSAQLNERLPDLCFAICRFSQVRFITPSHLTHNLFSMHISNSFWY